MDCIMTSKASFEKGFLPPARVLPGPAKKAVYVTSNTSTDVQGEVHSTVVKETKAVIIDIGTGSCKIGFAGEQKPSFVVSSTVEKPLRETCKAGNNQKKQHFIGKQKYISSDISQKLVNPLRHGIIVDWDCIEAILEYLFVEEMKIQSEEHAVLLSDPLLSPITNREKYIEMLFETFNIPAFYIANQSSLSMYSYRKTSGLVVECGHGMSSVVPIIEGNVRPSLACRADYAGADVTKYLMSILNKTGHKFNDEHLDIIEDLKSKYCYVSRDLSNEMCLPESKYQVDLIYTLPDGQCINVGKERFLGPEIIFQPSLIDSTQPGLQDMTMACINNNAGFKKNLLNNILLCGGMTMLKGFPERFQKELNKLQWPQKPCVISWPERQFSVWRGGSILASLNSFQTHWLYRKEYDEYGPSIIYRQFF